MLWSMYMWWYECVKEEHQAIAENKKADEALNWEDYKKMQFTCHVRYKKNILHEYFIFGFPFFFSFLNSCA